MNPTPNAVSEDEDIEPDLKTKVIAATDIS
jgi:hypothetical protein